MTIAVETAANPLRKHFSLQRNGSTCGNLLDKSPSDEINAGIDPASRLGRDFLSKSSNGTVGIRVHAAESIDVLDLGKCDRGIRLLLLMPATEGFQVDVAVRISVEDKHRFGSQVGHRES